jgi:hypothetical protein
VAYQRFKFENPDVLPATVATTATLRPENTQSVVNVASVAGNMLATEIPEEPTIINLPASGLDAADSDVLPATFANLATVCEPPPNIVGRAALIEIGAGVPREWAEGFALLDIATPLPGWPERRWRELVNKGGPLPGPLGCTGG